MNLRPHKLQSPELNLTPLIDVVFLLLIFFMVSTTFDRESRIKVELPTAATQDEKSTEEKVLDITVDAKGRYYVNQKEVVNTELKTLQRAIELAPYDAEPWRMLGDVKLQLYRATKDKALLAGAVTAWQKSLNLDTNQPELKKRLDLYAPLVEEDK